MSDESSPSFYFGLVCEGPADARTVQLLVKRVYESEIDWLRGIIDSTIGWTGVENSTEFTKWSGSRGVKRLAREKGIRVHGKFTGERWRGEALQATKALRLFRAVYVDDSIPRRPLVIFLIRDSDGILERSDGFETVRTSASLPFEVVVGIPNPMRECWILASAETEIAESEARRRLREELGFDPISQAHLLTAQSSDAKKNPKRVLAALFGGENPQFEHDILDTVALDLLDESDRSLGLASFLREIRQSIPDEIRKD